MWIFRPKEHIGGKIWFAYHSRCLIPTEKGRQAAHFQTWYDNIWYDNIILSKHSQLWNGDTIASVIMAAPHLTAHMSNDISLVEVIAVAENRLIISCTTRSYDHERQWGKQRCTISPFVLFLTSCVNISLNILYIVNHKCQPCMNVVSLTDFR